MRKAWRSGTALGLLALVSACDCIGERLVILEPDAGSVLGAADDADPVRGGLQRDVLVDVTNLPAGAPLDVRVLSPRHTLDDAPRFPTTVPASGRASVRVTLPRGASSLVACGDDDCTVRSPALPLSVVDSVSVCPFVVLDSPRPSMDGSAVSLTADDDVAADGAACGHAFAVDVDVHAELDDGTGVTLWLDGVPTARGVVEADHVSFPAVHLGVRGPDVTTMHLAIDGLEGRCVEQLLSATVTCGGPTCRLDALAAGDAIGLADDADPATPGVQVGPVVRSLLTTFGRPVTLLDARTETSLDTRTGTVVPPDVVTRFPLRTVEDGPLALAAVCATVERRTRSATILYQVDTVGCSVSFVDPPEDRVFTADDDQNGTLEDGVTITSRVAVSGEGCDRVRAGLCDALDAVDFEPVQGGGGGFPIDLGTAGSQRLCAEAVDAAGNRAAAERRVGVERRGAPSLAVVTPTPLARVNRAGGSYAGDVYLADAVPSTAACDLTVEVDCAPLGVSVELRVDGVATGQRAVCGADASSSLGGRARFPQVTLRDTATDSHTLSATATSPLGTGTASPVGLRADCAPPVPVIESPACGGAVTPADDRSALPGLQVPVSVRLAEVPQVDVGLRVSPGSGPSRDLASLASRLPAGSSVHTFSAVDLGSAGIVTLVAGAVDSFGNAGASAPCAVSLSGGPSINLDPLAKTVFSGADLTALDCAPGGGFDLALAGSTNATDGSVVSVTVGSTAPRTTTAVGGRFSLCTPLLPGTQTVRVAVTDTDARDGVSGTAAIVPVDLTVSIGAPPTPIAPIAATIVDRRAATASLRFTAVGDASGARLAAYQVRCRAGGIATEAEWGAATAQPFDAVTPAAPGAPEQLLVRGFHTGTTTRCLVRGVDAAGGVTPLASTAADAAVAPQFLVVTVAGTVPGGAMGVDAARGVSDVNGDGVPDLLVSGSGTATLLLGGSAGGPPTVATRFVKAERSIYFGTVVRPLGDLDGDGLADFAIADPSAPSGDFDGEVYVIRGRRTWPAQVVLSESGCVADACVRGEPGLGSALGYDVVGLGDFDGRPGPDLAVAAPGLETVYVFSGRQAPRNYVLGVDDPLGFTVSAPTGLFRFGWSLGAPGRLDGSAFDTLVIGQTGDFPGGSSDPAQLFRLRGRPLTASAGLTAIAPSELAGIATDAALSPSFGTYDFLGISSLDFDADGRHDLAVFGNGAAGSLAAGAYVLYGGAGSSFPVSGSTRVGSTNPLAGAALGVSRGVARDPVVGALGDLDRDGADELALGAITVDATSRHGVALVYGRAGRDAGTLTLESLGGRVALLSPAAEPLPASRPYPYYHVAFPGDLVRDGSLSYPDLVVLDPGTYDAAQPGDAGRLFILY